jgi:large subunit ribosomal protein L25
MQTVEITIERRAEQGKNAMRRLRRAGKVPAILYGPRRQSVAICASMLEFERKVGHLEGSHLIRLVAANGREPELHDKMVLVRELQRHPVSGDVLHADFYEVDLTERLQVTVALHFIGRAAGVVAGGILQPVLREIEVECLPTEIPEFIEVDVSALGIHDAVHLADIALPPGVTAVGEAAQTVVTVLPPSVEAAKPAEVAEAAVPAAEGAAPAAAPEAASAPKKGGGEG